MRVAVGIVLLTIVFLGAITLVALEGREVVVLRTFDARGLPRTTRTWVADADGAVWIEAANPERVFLRDVRVHPDVELRRTGRLYDCRGVEMPNPEGHQRIRSLLALKYGWADRWIGLLADTSQSLAIRLDCR